MFIQLILATNMSVANNLWHYIQLILATNMRVVNNTLIIISNATMMRR